MQTSVRRLADVAVKGARFLEAGQPTGLTGLPTHPTPRSTLLYTYERTLEKLSRLPAHSVYRQATEALTRQRLETIASIRPAGWDEWAGRASEKVRQRPELFSPGASRHQLHKINGVDYVQTDAQRVDATGYDLDQEWDGEENAATLEGTRSSQESRVNLRNLNKKAQISESDVQWEPEPQLDVQQYVKMVGRSQAEPQDRRSRKAHRRWLD